MATHAGLDRKLRCEAAASAGDQRRRARQRRANRTQCYTLKQLKRKSYTTLQQRLWLYNIYCKADRSVKATLARGWYNFIGSEVEYRVGGRT